MIKEIKQILDSDSGYAIAKNIGVRPTQINRLKNGERKIENISLELAEKILNHYAKVTIELKNTPLP